jgi:hypothetical protein
MEELRVKKSHVSVALQEPPYQIRFALKWYGSIRRDRKCDTGLLKYFMLTH